MAYNYVVTAHKASNVTHSLTAKFMGDELNLIVSKCTRIEFYKLGEESPTKILEVPLYGRVATMEVWRPAGSIRDMLFISTERYSFFILEWDPITQDVVTKAKGNVKDSVGRAAECGQIAIIEPQCRMIGLHLYEGYLKVVPTEAGGKLGSEAFNIRLEELHLIDLTFLNNYPKPTVALLYEDSKSARHLKTYEVLLKEKDFGEGPWGQANVESGAAKLIAVKAGGVVVLGEHTITYHSGSDFQSIPVSFSLFKVVDAIDDTRFLVGDQAGCLYLLVLQLDKLSSKVTGLALEKLGITTQASTLSYVDNGVVFVGSILGDSQLIELLQQPDMDNNFIKELDRSQWTNIGPIVDFVAVDVERQGQGQVVTCSGAYKDGSLRVVRNGIGISEQARLELPGVKGLWSFEAGGGAYLVLSFISETRVLAMEGEEELGEAELPGIDADAATVFCVNMGAAVVQVTTRSARLLDASLGLAEEWRPPAADGAAAPPAISMACSNGRYLLVATGGQLLHVLAVADGRWQLLRSARMAHEVSCVALSGAAASVSDAMDAEEAPPLAAAGLWTDLSVRLLSLPQLEEVHCEELGGEVIPRSLLFASMASCEYLLCALGDGHVLSFTLPRRAAQSSSSGTLLANRKSVAVGTQPVALVQLSRPGEPAHVFACSDRPTLVHASGSKLLYSSVNLKEVAHVTPFDFNGLHECLALVSDESLIIGAVEDLKKGQKLHLSTVPLGEAPRRLCYLEQERCFALLTTRLDTNTEGEEQERSFLRVLDDQTFERGGSCELQQHELAISILAHTREGEGGGSFVVVGTAFCLPEEEEPRSGRILVFQVSGRAVELRSEVKVKGAVYCLEAFNGHLLAGVNNNLQLYGWAEGRVGGGGMGGFAAELRLKHEHNGHILVLYLQSRGDFILVGDLMKSISLLQASAATDWALVDLARDFNSNWMTSVAFLDDESFLGADNMHNLFTLRKNADATFDEERSRLEVVGEFHLGGMVNCFRRGSLTMQLADGAAAPLPTLLYATVDGAIGVLATLPAAQFAFLSKVQTSIAQVVKGVGGLSHSEWRSFQNERKTAVATGFIDGDLIESFLELPRDKMEEVAAGAETTVDDLVRQIEELARLH